MTPGPGCRVYTGTWATVGVPHAGVPVTVLPVPAGQETQVGRSASRLPSHGPQPGRRTWDAATGTPRRPARAPGLGSLTRSLGPEVSSSLRVPGNYPHWQPSSLSLSRWDSESVNAGGRSQVPCHTECDSESESPRRSLSARRGAAAQIQVLLVASAAASPDASHDAAGNLEASP
jgi:hypothetical protein